MSALEPQIIDALKLVCDKYSKELAATVEKIFRNETKHFKSDNFLMTYGAGMEAFSDNFPYGWSSAKVFWQNNLDYLPEGIHLQKENSSALLKSRGVRKFIIFPSVEASVMTVAYIINKRNGNGGAWFSTDAVAQRKYNEYLKGIMPRYVNKF